MTTQEFITFVYFISALIDKKIEEAFGRDALHETLILSQYEKELKEILVDEDDSR